MGLQDEPKVSAFVQHGLIAERYATDVSADGREGLELAPAFPYELIILDVILPRLGATMPAFETDTDDYPTKSFAFTELLGQAEALLRRGPVNRLSTLVVGKLELDVRTSERLRAKLEKHKTTKLPTHVGAESLDAA